MQRPPRQSRRATNFCSNGPRVLLQLPCHQLPALYEPYPTEPCCKLPSRTATLSAKEKPHPFPLQAALVQRLGMCWAPHLEAAVACEVPQQRLQLLHLAVVLAARGPSPGGLLAGRGAGARPTT